MLCFAFVHFFLYLCTNVLHYMGVLRKKDVNYTEDYIIQKLEWYLLSSSTVKYNMSNLYVFDNSWESDYLAITKSGYLYEGEVKISRADFKKDFDKKKKHKILKESYDKLEGMEGIKRPHYFFYAVPENLITEDEVPEYAGLVYITQHWPFAEWVKKPPKLHNEKFSDEDLNLTNKFYYNMVQWKYKAKTEVKNLKELLNEAKTDENGKTYKYTLPEYEIEYDKLDAENKHLKERVQMLEADIKEFIKEQRDSYKVQTELKERIKILENEEK